MIKIPFNKPLLLREELSSVREVIKSGRIGGNGPMCQKVEGLMRKLFNVGFAFLTTSCTHSLETAIMALDIKDGDEVILPSFSFVSTANAIVRALAKPVFVDIQESYLNIDPYRVEMSITPKTKAIICVHYAGFPCQMDEIVKIAKRYNLYIIEDAAQAIGSKFEDKFLGTIGDIGCFSFHETKNFTCGEGGAFLTNDKKIAKKAQIIIEKGTNRSQFLQGRLNKYLWIDKGSSYVMSDILAAILFIQLHRIEYIIKKRKSIGLKYMKELKKLEEEGKVILPPFHPEINFNWHIFYVRVRNQKTRDYVIKKLRMHRIEATFHFVPLHLSPYARRVYGYRKGIFPVTENVSSTLIRLPIYPNLSINEQDYIIDSLYKILK